MENRVLLISILTTVILFTLTCKAQNDIAIDSTYIHFMATVDGVDTADGFYSNRPINQVVPIAFGGKVENVGAFTQTNVCHNVLVEDQTGSPLFSTGDTLATFSNGMNEWFHLNPWYTPTTTGRNYVNQFADQTETDQFPDDNIADTTSFNISENKVISRFIYLNDNFSPAEYSNSPDGNFAGVRFTLSDYDTIHSFSVYIDSMTDPGTFLYGVVYEKMGTWISKAETEERFIQASDIGTWITIPIVSMEAGDDFLEPGVFYLAGFEFYFNGMNLYIGSDTTGSHHYPIETNFRDSLGRFVEEIPAIRLNFGNYTMGSNEIEYDHYEFSTYPNPVKDRLYIGIPKSNNKVSVKIFNITGQELQCLSSKINNKIAIDMKSFLPGVYVLEISSEENSFTKKILKN